MSNDNMIANATEAEISVPTVSSSLSSEEVVGTSIDVKVPDKLKEVPPINPESALQAYSEEERHEIIALSEAIDVRKTEQVTVYGAGVLQDTYNECQTLIKKESGSFAEQKVKSEVIAIAQKASESYDDFNLELKEPNLFQKLFLRITTGGRRSHSDKIQDRAITCYSMIGELRKSLDGWLGMLNDSMQDIQNSAMGDIQSVGLLEKYIIAGKLAQPRIAEQIENAKTQAQETGLQKYSYEYEELKRGYELFQIVMANLEKSRALYVLSVGQLALNKRSNENLQLSVKTQRDHTMAVLAQQLRNAIINAKTQEVLEGQKSLYRLNDELVRHVSTNIGMTAQETEKLLYNGFCNVEAAKEALTTVINSCKEIRKVADDMLPKLETESQQLRDLVDELKPEIQKANDTARLSTNTNTTTIATTVGDGLKF